MPILMALLSLGSSKSRKPFCTPLRLGGATLFFAPMICAQVEFTRSEPACATPAPAGQPGGFGDGDNRHDLVEPVVAEKPVRLQATNETAVIVIGVTKP